MGPRQRQGRSRSKTHALPIILLSFLGIMCHVGIDVGTNTTAPKILMERLGMTLADAGFATSLYFAHKNRQGYGGF